MATITPTFTNQGELTIVQWSNMLNGDDGAPYAFAPWADRSVQVTGTFGVAGNARWEGSNDTVIYGVLTDPQGNPLDFTSAKLESVTELARQSRPRITAGDATTSITVTLVAFNTRTARGG